MVLIKKFNSPLPSFCHKTTLVRSALKWKNIPYIFQGCYKFQILSVKGQFFHKNVIKCTQDILSFNKNMKYKAGKCLYIVIFQSRSYLTTMEINANGFKCQIIFHLVTLSPHWNLLLINLDRFPLNGTLYCPYFICSKTSETPASSYSSIKSSHQAIYSQTCVKQSLLGKPRSGCLRWLLD